MFINITGIKLPLTVWLFGKKIKNISSDCHVLYTTSKLVNSRRHLVEDGKEMYQNAKCTCRPCRDLLHFEMARTIDREKKVFFAPKI